MGSQAYIRAGAIGAGAGVVASVVQAAIGVALDKLLLPPGHDNNIAPRLINRTARQLGHRSNPVVDWLLGTGFHLGYGMGWGGVFGVLRHWSGLPSPALAAALACIMYLVAFSPFGAGTQTGTEREPRKRPWQKQVSLLSVPLAYTLPLAALYDRLAQPSLTREREPRLGSPPRPGVQGYRARRLSSRLQQWSTPA
jgi:hypothetical protein